MSDYDGLVDAEQTGWGFEESVGMSDPPQMHVDYRSFMPGVSLNGKSIILQQCPRCKKTGSLRVTQASVQMIHSVDILPGKRGNRAVINASCKFTDEEAKKLELM